MVTYIYLLDNEKKPINSIPSGTSTGMDIAKDLAKVYTEKHMDVAMSGRNLERELWKLKVMDNLDILPDDMKEYMKGIPKEKIYCDRLSERINDEFIKIYPSFYGKFPEISDEEIEADLPKYLESVLKSYEKLGQIGAGVIVINDRYLIRSSQNF